MRSILLFFLCAAAAMGAGDPWTKVRDLKSGTEIRVFKKGSATPVLGKIDELSDDNLVIVLKNEQVAIPRDQIDRIDARPPGGRVAKESKTTVSEPDATPRPQQRTTPGESTSSNVTIHGKPDFETIYRRATGAPKK
ncbi:MAG: hypothetical protein LAP87_05765 [Acidobacteriia bacterium]|nr:hypothetical protein [Terriglobia bacterium]